MRYVSLFICGLALCGCKSAEQITAEAEVRRTRVISQTKSACADLGYPSGSIENARCAEGLFKKAMDENAAEMQAGATIAAAQARNRVSCTGYGNTVNCY
jgi:hypothetical protein